MPPGLIAGAASLVGGILSKKAGDKQAEAIRAGGQQAAQTLSPFVGAGAQANDAVLGALGQQGFAGQQGQFQNFLNSTGFQEQLRAGSEAITGNQAARGMLNSGATLKRLNRFGQDLGQQGFQNFIGNLQGVAGRGAGAAGATASALTGAATGGANAAASGQAGLISGVTGGVQGFGTSIAKGLGI